MEWLASLSISSSTSSSNASECFLITGDLQIRDISGMPLNSLSVSEISRMWHVGDDGFNNGDFKGTDGAVVGEAERFSVSGAKEDSFVENDLVIKDGSATEDDSGGIETSSLAGATGLEGITSSCLGLALSLLRCTLTSFTGHNQKGVYCLIMMVGDSLY